MDSMTGYGQGFAESEELRVVVTLRGVNHRFLDLSTRLTDLARGSELAVQRRLKESVTRGRVELTADITAIRESSPEVSVDAGVAAALAGAASRLVEADLAGGELSVSDLVQMPEVVRMNVSAPEWGAAGETVLLDALSAALEQFLASRREEGSRLASVVEQKIDILAELVSRLEALRPEVQAAVSRALRERIAELTGDHELDVGRLEQEVALLIDRSNVSEELERLTIHLEHVREVMAETAAAVGKRLDFLVQEIFRELNTLAAKCRSTEMTRITVDAKVLCEEIREQLRNVE
jgi:uncharacterized protein (TIGR00255 family)